MRDLFVTQPVRAHEADIIPGKAVAGEITLKRALTAKHLVMLGIGAIIGAGIFVLTGHAAAEHAGPAVVLSFIFAGIACAFAGLCYAEFASMLPVSGSAYSYSYATLGEIVAWFIGWMLILEYLFAASTVAVGWSGYFNSLLQSVGEMLHISLALPPALASAPLTVTNGVISTTGGLVNLPAVLIIAAISWLCCVGISQSASVNAVIVAIKLVVILMFVAFGLSYINTANWVPFVPPTDASGHFGWAGVFRGASVVFFSYIGFDAVSTAAQEAKNPQRDMPIGILGSLVICTVIYIIVSAVLTGLAHYTTLNTPHPVVTALESYPGLRWLRIVIEIGAIAGLSSVILVMLLGQPRIFYTMAQDGLVPPLFKIVHPRWQTPYVGQILVGVFAAILAGLLPIGVLGDLVSMGTLLAFSTVCVGVLVLRKTRPDMKRPFRVPAAPVVCTLGALSCFALFLLAFKDNWQWMSIYMVLGLVVYFGYGYRNSKLRRG